MLMIGEGLFSRTHAKIKWMMVFVLLLATFSMIMTSVSAQDRKPSYYPPEENFTLSANPSSVNIEIPFDGYIVLSVIEINVTYTGSSSWGYPHTTVYLSSSWVGPAPEYGILPIGPWPRSVTVSKYEPSEFAKQLVVILKSVPTGSFTLRVTGTSHWSEATDYVDITITVSEIIP